MGRKKDSTGEDRIINLVSEYGLIETADIKEALDLPSKTVSYYFNKIYSNLSHYQQ